MSKYTKSSHSCLQRVGENTVEKLLLASNSDKVYLS